MTRGGYRKGAGRPAGKGKFGESTKPLRIPESRIEDVMAFLQDATTYELPLYGSKVQAGFPSPADDYIEAKLDLNKHLVKHPTATFFVRATGQSMINAGIHPGDILIVDRSLEVKSGKIVIAALNGELTVKRYKNTKQGPFLMPENDDFPPIPLTDDHDVHIWGVVTNVLHAV